MPPQELVTWVEPTNGSRQSVRHPSNSTASAYLTGVLRMRPLAR